MGCRGRLSSKPTGTRLLLLIFFAVEVWGLRGLVTFYVLVAIELSNRRNHFSGATPNPNTQWMMQIARNLTDPVDGFVMKK